MKNIRFSLIFTKKWEPLFQQLAQREADEEAEKQHPRGDREDPDIRLELLHGVGHVHGVDDHAGQRDLHHEGADVFAEVLRHQPELLRAVADEQDEDQLGGQDDGLHGGLRLFPDPEWTYIEIIAKARPDYKSGKRKICPPRRIITEISA